MTTVLSTVTPEELRAFLCRDDVQRRIRGVVRARLGKDAPKQLAEDIAQDANVTMLSAKALPRSMATADGWVSALARRAVVHHFRRGSCDAKWLDPEGDVDALPADGGEIPAQRMAHQRVARGGRPAERQGRGDPRASRLPGADGQEVPRGRGRSRHHVGQALKSRVHEFKKKYEPRWRRRQGMYVLIVLLGAALVAIAAALVWILVRPTPADIRPDPSPHRAERHRGPPAADPAGDRQGAARRRGEVVRRAAVGDAAPTSWTRRRSWTPRARARSACSGCGG